MTTRKIRYESLFEPGVDALFENFTATAFRLETRQNYNEPSEAEAFRHFVAGEPLRDFSCMESWWQEVRAGIAAGKSYRRLQIVTEPLTDYVRFLFAWARQRSTAVGEDVRILALAPDEDWPAEIPHTDFWLFDSTRLLNLAYDGQDTFLYAELVDDAEAVHQAIRIRDLTWGLAVPFNEYVAGLDEGMRPSASPA